MTPKEIAEFEKAMTNMAAKVIEERAAGQELATQTNEDLSAAMGEASMAAARYGNGASNRAGRCISDLENHIARLNGLIQSLSYDLGRVIDAAGVENVAGIVGVRDDLLERATAIAEEFEALCLSRLS